MDEKLKATINKVVQLSRQNSEFDNELRKALGMGSSAINGIIDNERFNHIYEYCIEEVIRKQAQEFYHDFPISSIIPNLVDDYIRMEAFHRKDNFGDFCLALYQQIECITNKICESSSLSEIVDKLWGYGAYLKTIEGQTELDIRNRSDNYRIADLIFPGDDRKTGVPFANEKSLKTLQNQTATDKIKIVVYYFGYGAKMKNSDYDTYREITGLFGDLYQCRNMNHRGNTLYPWEEEILERIKPLKSLYYFKFLGGLALYVDQIKNGYSSIASILEYAKSVPFKKVERRTKEPKILGKIDPEVLERLTKKRK